MAGARAESRSESRSGDAAQRAGEGAPLALSPLRARLLGLCDRAGLAATLILPLFLLYGRALAEVMIGLADASFLASCLLLRTGISLQPLWRRAALLWWGWEILCALPLHFVGLGPGGWPSLLQALALGRFLLFALALEERLLASPSARRALQAVLAAAATFIALASWEQYLTGRNFLGAPRAGDGALTGPFIKPRAGAPFVRLLFPAMLPPVITLLNRPRLPARMAGAALAAFGLVTVILIGQRMPALLAGLGLLVGAWLLPQWRKPALLAVLAAVLVLVATPIISPPTAAKLLARFGEQMAHFATSAYGQLYIRALRMTLAHPLFGFGFDGFRLFCPEPRFWHGLPLLGITDQAAGGAEICNLHPHNYYLQAATDGGFPGLILFAALAVAWLARLGHGLRRAPEPLRVGLFLAALIHLWPLASTSGLAALPDDGWFYLMLGFGLAEARVPPSAPP